MQVSSNWITTRLGLRINSKVNLITLNWSSLSLRAVVCLSLLTISFSSSSKEVEFESNQAIVVAEVELYRLSFEEINTGDEFIIKGERKTKYVPLTVKPGRYYLKSINPVYARVAPLYYEKPEHEHLTFDIKPEAVSYLGKWIINTKLQVDAQYGWEVKRDYSDRYLRTLLNRRNYLAKYPLVISNEQGKTLDIAWDDLKP